MHILALIMLHQHRLRVYVGQRKLKLLIMITLYFSQFLVPDYQVLVCVVNIFWKIWKKKSSQLVLGMVGLVTVNFFFSP